jgi:hypothetical protein
VIPIARPDDIGESWKDWVVRSRRARDELMEKYHPGDQVTLDALLYQEIKPLLLELFYSKCAYCESEIDSSQPGDVEHYRPKAGVRDTKGVVRVRIQGTEVDHPGYWWLAYDWHNLLPACNDCNRRRKHGVEKEQAGKGEYFDVRGTRAVLPGDNLTLEQPLLLDPAAPGFDPKQHFIFSKDGKVRPLTDEARYCCKLLGLNKPREKLVALREAKFLEARKAFLSLFQEVYAPLQTRRKTCEYINYMWEGRCPYGAFAREGLQAARELVRASVGALIPLPLPMPSS